MVVVLLVVNRVDLKKAICNQGGVICLTVFSIYSDQLFVSRVGGVPFVFGGLYVLDGIIRDPIGTVGESSM